MSIIVDALERVQEERHQNHTQFEEVPPTARKNDSAGHIYISKRKKKRKRPKLTKKNMAIGITCLAFAINAYLIYENTQQNKHQFSQDVRNSLSPIEVKTVKEIYESFSADEILFDNEFTHTTDEAEPKRTQESIILALGPTPTDIKPSNKNPISIIQKELASEKVDFPTKLSDKTITETATHKSSPIESKHLLETKQALSEASITNQKPQSTETKIEESIFLIKTPSSLIKTSNSVTKKNPTITENIVNTVGSQPDWLNAGRVEFEKRNSNNAIKIWRKGLLSLSAKTPIISIMINRVPNLAEKTLAKLIRNNIDAFFVQGLFKGKPAFFTLALYPKKKPDELMKDIERVVTNKPFKTTQSYVQKRINRLIEHSKNKTTINEKLSNRPTQKKTVERKRISNEKRLMLAQEAVYNGNYHDAILKLRPVLFNSEAKWEVLFWIGSAKLGLGLYNQADDYFKNALALNADIPQLWTQRAIIAQEKNNHIGALKYLHKAKNLSPEAPEIALNIAYSNDALGDRNGAVYSYREFMSLTRGNTFFSQQRQAVDLRLEELGL